VSCYRLIDPQKAHHGVSHLARVLGVARAGYYAWASRPPSDRARQDALLGEQIRQIHARSRGTYGAPRVHAELRLGLDVRVGRKRVARLMREHGLQGVHRRRRGGLTRRDPHAVPAPDLVERDLTPAGPDRLWVADITQQRTDQGWLYLAVVLDAFSRRIVGWSMADHLRTELVLDALDMAISQRNPAAGLVCHSDHGCAIHLVRLRPPPHGLWPGRFHGHRRGRARQRCRRELLRHPGMRAARPPRLA
jgi:putative transposase